MRENLDLEPGQKLQAIGYKGRIEQIPVEPIEASRGFLRGIDTSVPRESDRLWSSGGGTAPTPQAD